MKKVSTAVFLSALSGVSGGNTVQCHGGLIQDQRLNGDLVVTGGPCSIISSTISGDVRVVDSKHIVMLNNEIGGKVRVIRSSGREGDGVANIFSNTVLGGSFVVQGYAVANVIENETRIGSIRVNENTEALVQKNISAYNLICRDNMDLSAFVNFAKETLSCQ